jgi:DNA-binding transcriptional LysR family regulator
MTAAAEELHLTQSGISQHIRALEEVLEKKLFDRVKQRLIPTAAAEAFFDRVLRGLDEIEAGLRDLSGESTKVRGTVRIGIPLEFGHDVVVPLVGKLQAQYPEIKVKMQVGLGPRLNDLILLGELDFAFVDELITDKRVLLEGVYNEDLELCVSQDLLKKSKGYQSQSRKFFETLPFVDYESGEPLLRKWFQHHFAHKGMDLTVRAYVEDAYCISQLIVSGVGAGILPGALVQSLIKAGKKIYVFPGRGKPLKSGISIASIRERSYSLAASVALKFLKENIAKLG